jgi:hypothetical protein
LAACQRVKRFFDTLRNRLNAVPFASAD